MFKKLQQCPVFIGLAPEDIREIFDLFSYKSTDYKKNELVALAEDECRHFHILLHGTVRGEMTDFSGKVIKIEDIESPRPLAPAFLFGSSNRFPVDITANESCTILSFTKDVWLQIMQKDQRILQNYLSIIANRSQFLSNRIRFLSFQSIKGKLAWYIFQQVKQQKSQEIVLQHSQNQLSELFGVARPSIGRALAELNSDGIISHKGKTVSILQQQQLSDYLK